MRASMAEFERLLDAKESFPVKQLEFKPNNQFTGNNGQHYDFELVWTGEQDTVILAEWDRSKLIISRLNTVDGSRDTIYTGTWEDARPVLRLINGKLTYHDAKKLLLFDAQDFKLLTTVTELVFDRWLEVSPDATRIAYVDRRGLWLADLANSQRKLLAEANQEELLPSQPRWSPAGDKLLYIDMYWEGSGGIWVIDLASGEKKKAVDLEGCYSANWTPDAKGITFFTSEYGDEGPPRSYIYYLDSARLQEITTGENYYPGAFSPDGTLLSMNWLFGTSESATLWVKDIGTDTNTLVSKKPGIYRSYWSPGGKSLIHTYQSKPGAEPSFWLVDLAGA